MAAGAEGDGVPAQQPQLMCERDGNSTRLTCVQCATPICPSCLVRTPVGMKCAVCGAEPGALLRRRKPLWMRLAPMGVVALVVLVVALPRIVGGSDTSSDTTADALAGNPRPQPPANFGLAGQEVIDGSLAFTVTSIECGATQVTGGPSTRTAQGKFCFLAVTLRNVGRSPITFQGRAQMLQDSQQRTFGPDTSATAAHPGNAGRDMLAPVVNPGNELVGVLVFDVPSEVSLVGVSLRSGPTGRGAFVKLG
jgi:hypothetical protein